MDRDKLYSIKDIIQKIDVLDTLSKSIDGNAATITLTQSRMNVIREELKEVIDKKLEKLILEFDERVKDAKQNK